jgi:hypothetical protein
MAGNPQSQEGGLLVEGDVGFIGLNTRESPTVLQQGMISYGKNIRIDRGVISVRKGVKRLTVAQLFNKTIYGACPYTNTDGSEIIIIATNAGLYYFYPSTNSVNNVPIAYPNGEVVDAPVQMYQAKANVNGGFVYILRGFNKQTLRWDGSSLIVLPTNQTHHNFPNAKSGIWYGNRHIVNEGKNSFAVSHYLVDNAWSKLDRFTINDGGNDTLVAITPWTLNEFVVFMRNSAFYANVGIGAVASGEAVPTDSYVKSLVTDIGCIAPKSIVQAAGGVIFLSDNGVYILQPSQSSAAEGMRLLTLSLPLSAPIDDIIKNINMEYAHNSVAVYWNNRYYIAVPLGTGQQTNNCLLVYNFINKNWESIDTYQPGFDIKHLIVAKKGTSRRLFAIDTQEGIFEMETLEHDEYTGQTGSPRLDKANNVPQLVQSLGQPVLSSIIYTPNPIIAEVRTRAYSFGTLKEKRYSSVSTELDLTNSSWMIISSITVNPDSETVVDNFSLVPNQNTVRRTPIRKIGNYTQIKYVTYSGQPSIRATTVHATMVGNNTISKR